MCFRTGSRGTPNYPSYHIWNAVAGPDHRARLAFYGKTFFLKGTSVIVRACGTIGRVASSTPVVINMSLCPGASISDSAEKSVEAPDRKVVRHRKRECRLCLPQSLVT